MRTLNAAELTTVTGAGTQLPSAAQIQAALTALTTALAAKGIKISLDKTAGTVTITTTQGSKTIKLPALPTAPTTTA
jgi:hypothetical protein